MIKKMQKDEIVQKYMLKYVKILANVLVNNDTCVY